MIVGSTSAATRVDISNLPPVRPVKPVTPVVRQLDQPAATFTRSNPAPAIQLSYGPPTNPPNT